MPHAFDSEPLHRVVTMCACIPYPLFLNFALPSLPFPYPSGDGDRWEALHPGLMDTAWKDVARRFMQDFQVMFPALSRLSDMRCLPCYKHALVSWQDWYCGCGHLFRRKQVD